MTEQFILSPRYRLDDEYPWLEGIDPSRHYWISVNSDSQLQIAIPGLVASSTDELKAVMSRFRSLVPQDVMTVERIAGSFTLRCISTNCYAIESEVQGALAWHLFDRETIESLLMTSHPDWLPSPKDIELGRKRIALAFAQPAYV